MLAGLASLRNYLIVSAVVAILLIGIQILFGQPFVDALNSLNRSARSAGMAQVIADAVTEPIKIVVTPNSPIPAIIGGFLWPLLIVWALLVFALIFYTVLGRGFNQAANTIR
jgi:hypothetical protein